MLFVNGLSDRRDELNVLIKKVEKILNNTPDDKLQCRKKENAYRYAYVPAGISGNRENRAKEIYLSASDPMATRLAKRDYYRHYLKDLIEERDAIEEYLQSEDKTGSADRFLEKHPGINELLKGEFIDRKSNKLEWAKQEYIRNNKHPEHLIHRTNGGFMVRSKTEAMVTNILIEEGIPFRYEERLKLPDGNVIYPDFHIYSLRDLKEWYWEHFGMMLDENYFRSYMNKINMLRSAGIIPGVNLIQTFEAEGHPISEEEVRAIVRLHLK